MLRLDDEGVYLAVAKSQLGLYVDPDLDQMVLHYDYDRTPSTLYPEAHFQITGTSAPLEELARRAGVDKMLRDYHFPVGGRRFRPTVEDVVEFLIVEGLADGRPGRQDAVDEHRTRWHERQLLAAVRRSPDVVRLFLEDLQGD